MGSTGTGASYDDAATAALHAAELARQRDARDARRRAHEEANSPVARAFRLFEGNAGRTAGFAATTVVRASDFGLEIERLDERLAARRQADTVLSDVERTRLTDACTEFASAFATGREREAHAPFRAALASVQADLLVRLATVRAS